MTLDHWYDLELIIKILNGFERNTLARIGECVPRNSQFPSSIQSFADGLRNLNRAYQLNHLGGDIGEYVVEQRSDSEFLVRCETPYPNQFNYGLIKGLAKQFEETVDVVEVANTIPGGKFACIVLS